MEGRILLLQGPMGPFFKRLARDLESLDGCEVYKINFNAGDRLFFDTDKSVDFNGTIEQWPEFLSRRIEAWKINRMFMFGDTRPLHLVASNIARKQSIWIDVFEEGYLRPHYITLEEEGVNGRSSIPSNPEFYRYRKDKPEQRSVPIASVYRNAAWYGALYYAAAWFERKNFPHYVHHRPFNPFQECFLWWRGFARKLYYKIMERNTLEKLTADYSDKFFLAPLQVHCDAQIKTCKRVASAAAFIRRVIGSFARNAPEDTLLVLKHHPLDRGHSDYTALVKKLAARSGCEDRVLYVHDLHLPTLLDHARATIVINSTVGISSLAHNTPVKVLGPAIYDMQGLTFQGGLNEFWGAPGKVDRVLNRKFRNYLISTSQMIGNFYSKVKGVHNATGMVLQHLIAYSGADNKGEAVQVSGVAPDVIACKAVPALQRSGVSVVSTPLPVYDAGRDVSRTEHGDTVA